MSRTLVVDGDHLKRLLQVCRLLTTGSGMSLKQLRGRLKTSRRTIFRDLTAIEANGISLDRAGGGYRIRETAQSCRRKLAAAQTKALDKLLKACLK